MVLLLTALIWQIQGTLQIDKITENNGYVEIRISEVEIINTTSILLHVINIREVRNILHNISENIQYLDIHSIQILQNEIDLINSKIQTLIPKGHRDRRGLINAGGRLYKWLFGTMDDDDRQEISEHLSIIDQNSHNSINTLNKQIIINNSINKSLEHLKVAVESDRKEIETSFVEIKKSNNEFIKRLFYLDQLAKLKTLDHKIDQIQDNIVSAKNNIIHPSILTTQEINQFDIDYYKLKMLKVGIMAYSDESIIIAITIPDTFIRTDLKMIVPIPNSNYFEIVSNDEYIVNINNMALKYQENVPLRKLKKSKHCSFYNNCKFNFNNVTDLLNIDDESIIIKNALAEPMTQNCDGRKLNLTGNFLVVFNNCSITFNTETFSNKKFMFKEKYFYPDSKQLSTPNVNPKFNNIVTEHFENIKEIKELEFHKHVSYGINLTLTIIVVTVLILLICIVKRNNIKINIKEKTVQNQPERGRGNEAIAMSASQNNLEEIVRKYNT